MYATLDEFNVIFIVKNPFGTQDLLFSILDVHLEVLMKRQTPDNKMQLFLKQSIFDENSLVEFPSSCNKDGDFCA
jgi:hypothetical protein